MASYYYNKSADFFLTLGFDMKQREIKAARQKALEKLENVRESIKTALKRYNELKEQLLDVEKSRKDIEKETDLVIQDEIGHFYQFDTSYKMTDTALRYKLKCDEFNSVCMSFNASSMLLSQLRSIMHKLDNDLCSMNLQLMELRRLRVGIMHITELDSTPVATVDPDDPGAPPKQLATAPLALQKMDTV